MALEKTIEKDDLLTRMRIREVLLFGLIVMSAILAQLPPEVLGLIAAQRSDLTSPLGDNEYPRDFRLTMIPAA